MNLSVGEIERVVREVLAELSAAHSSIERPATAVAGAAEGSSDAAPPGPHSWGAQPSESRVVDSRDNGELIVSSRVITMMEVSGRLDGVRRVVVARGTIVTPAVRDELIRRGIALSFADSPNGKVAPAVRLAMISTGTDFDPTALVAGLTREGLTVENSTLDCLIASTDQLAAEVAKGDTLGVLLTRHTAAGLCLANRLGEVRAVAGGDASAVAAAAAAVGANLLVVDPLAGTFFQLKQVVTEFCRGGIRPCPAVFRTRLA